MNRFLLIDCNNFFVSCERVFNPRLLKKPVVVLSSNDVCIIARSQEAKALGIVMGDSAYRCQALFKKHQVIVLSANFALYGDLSARVMQVLEQESPAVDVYSVDEAFIRAPAPCATLSAAEKDAYYLAYAHHLKQKIYRYTGIPVSIGIGPTMTLAKVAIEIAKKQPDKRGVFDISDPAVRAPILATFDVADVWGIGYRYAAFLRSHRINTAAAFIQKDDRWICKHLTIAGLKTAWELSGRHCIAFGQGPHEKQSITVSRLFGNRVTTESDIQEALASHVACAAHKVRAQQSLVAHLSIFLTAQSHFDPQRHYWSAHTQLGVATDYTPTLITAAHHCLHSLFRPGYLYKKVGIIFDELVPQESAQLNLFEPHQKPDHKQHQLMRTIDCVNTKWGRNTLFFAAEGTQQPWKMQQAQKSSCFTTNWHELLTV